MVPNKYRVWPSCVILNSAPCLCGAGAASAAAADHAGVRAKQNKLQNITIIWRRIGILEIRVENYVKKIASNQNAAPVWLFDLDNTLHHASHAIFPAIVANMNDYIARVLGDGVTPASAAVVAVAFKHKWKRYGATMLGLVKHHDVEPAHFLEQTHDLPGLDEMIRAERGLGQLLRRLPGRKILLTNAPLRYSSEVLRALGLRRHFSQHIAVEAMRVRGQLLHPGGRHAGQPAQRQGARHAYRVDHPIPEAGPDAHACAGATKSPRLRRCQSKIGQAAAGPLASPPLKAVFFPLRFSSRFLSPITILWQALRRASAGCKSSRPWPRCWNSPRAKKSPPPRWRASWNFPRPRCTAISPARRRCSRG